MTEIDHHAGAIAPAASQATSVEQTRATAEVAAAIQVARNFPREMHLVNEAMRQACQQYALASRAFWAYRQGGEDLEGGTVILARRLAAIFGNVEYGTVELSRGERQSEIRVDARELERNAHTWRSVVVPHRRYTGKNAGPLTSGRDIDANNNSVGGRLVREALFAVLPDEFVAEAKRLCRETLEHGADAGKPGRAMNDRVAEAIAAFGRARPPITPDMLERRVGRPSAQWTPADVASLEVLYGSLRSKEISRAEAFPDPDAPTPADQDDRRITTADIPTAAATADDDAAAAEEYATPGADTAEPEGWTR